MKKIILGFSVLLGIGLLLAGCANPMDVDGSARGVWNVTADDRADAITVVGTPSTRTNASNNGYKIPSNAHTARVPGFFFIWDQKQKDQGLLRVDATTFADYESIVLTAKNANVYTDYEIVQPDFDAEYYVFFIPYVAGKNINMVWLELVAVDTCVCIECENCDGCDEDCVCDCDDCTPCTCIKCTCEKCECGNCIENCPCEIEDCCTPCVCHKCDDFCKCGECKECGECKCPCELTCKCKCDKLGGCDCVCTCHIWTGRLPVQGGNNGKIVITLNGVAFEVTINAQQAGTRNFTLGGHNVAVRVNDNNFVTGVTAPVGVVINSVVSLTPGTGDSQN